MKITNRLGLPQPLVDAVTRDPYTKGDAHYSVTELIGPAHLARLSREHADDICEDAADRIWSLLGSAVHGILERAANGHALAEERITIEMDGARVSGGLDHFAFTDKTLSDYKVTSAWSVLGGEAKPEWVAQLNVYAYLLGVAKGITVERLQIVAVLRDWSKSKARDSEDYPQQQVAVVPAAWWGAARTEGYLRDRIAAHRAETPDICTAEERWEKPTTYAVMRRGAKKALRVLPSEHDAANWAATQNTYPAGSLSVEERPGEPVRCAGYCPVARWCEFGRGWAK